MQSPANDTYSRKTHPRSFLHIVWWICLGGVVALVLLPVSVGLGRMLLVVSIPVLTAGASFLLWSRRWLRWLPLIALAGLVLLLLAPGRDCDVDRLRSRYITSLQRYEGTRYVWGGENRFGIDCSGLVRRGLIDAHLWEGLVTANPALVREAARLWWFDCSARSLKDNYRGWTRLLFTAPAINDVAPERFRAGDIAVTSSGVHVLVYLGGGEWLQADSTPGKVVRGRPPTDSNKWFSVPVHVLRWQFLE